MMTLDALTELAESLLVYDIARPVLADPRFPIWSGSSKKGQHHYGKGGLILHTSEVIDLCLNNNHYLDYGIPSSYLFLAALYHDVGKMWDYRPVKDDLSEWEGTDHKRNIHHISRSAIEWNLAAAKVGYDQTLTDEITHAILAHHGRREWGSPVAPKSKLAWMLHLCDGISARMNDAETFDCIK